MSSLDPRRRSGSTAYGQFCVSRTGTLVFASGGIGTDSPAGLVWIDRKGQLEIVKGFDKPLFG